MMGKPERQGEICRQSFAACLGVMLAICIPLVVAPDTTAVRLEQVYTYISNQFGVLYLFSGVLSFGFLLWLALSRFGNVKLGNEDDSVEFKEFSWAGMLFCTGVGAGLLYWAVIEWGYYFSDPPHGIEKGTTAAQDWASAYGLFHWGPIAWAFYCLLTITIAYPFYVKKAPYLRLSTSLHGILGAEGLQGPAARAVDILFVLSLLGGAGYSLGISTPMISGGVSHLTGYTDGFGMQVITALFCVALFGTSAYLGLKKGIKILSDWNVSLALLLLAFVLLAGPTVFILKASFSSLGFMLINFVRMSTWADPFTDSGFVESWTVFYWAWWVAYAPFVGLFVARISCGRTIRQLITGMLVYGSSGGLLFFMILGNYGLHLETVKNVGFVEVMQNLGEVAAIMLMLKSLPFANLLIAAFCLISLIFCATTYDSASYIIASTVTKKLRPGEDPAKWNRLFWAFALAALPIALMYIGASHAGTSKAIRSILLVTSFPILFIGALSAYSLVKQLGADSTTKAPRL